jgi:hypothetical protein
VATGYLNTPFSRIELSPYPPLKMRIKHMYAQSYLDLANTLTTVAVFAGAISFGTLVTLPIGIDNADYIGLLLAVASYLFTSCLFAAVAIAYLLRHDDRNRPLSKLKRGLCQIHIWLVILLCVAGFIVLNVVIMNFGQRAVGIAGIASLSGLVPVWFISVHMMERTGKLDHETFMVENEAPQGGFKEPAPTSNSRIVMVQSTPRLDH